MEQFEVVFKPVAGYEHVVIKGENGELIVRLVPNSPVTSQDGGTCSRSQAVESTAGEAKYFTKITAEDREKVKEWLAQQTNASARANYFLRIVKMAVQEVNYDYWIANLEPSVKYEEIYYAEGENVGIGFSSKQFAQMAKEYAPERGSRLSTLYELFIWYSLRIVNGLWTLKYVAQDSSSAGNYWDAPDSSHEIEKTGARKCGGYADGQGNTCKIVTIEDRFLLVGGYYDCNGHEYYVAYVRSDFNPNITQYNQSGVLVLTK